MCLNVIANLGKYSGSQLYHLHEERSENDLTVIAVKIALLK